MKDIAPTLFIPFLFAAGFVGTEPEGEPTRYESCLQQAGLPINDLGHIEADQAYVLDASDETGSQGEKVYVPVTNIVMHRKGMFDQNALKQTDMDQRVMDVVNSCYALSRQP